MKRSDRLDPSSKLFPHLAKLGIATTWAARSTPVDDLWTECVMLAADAETAARLKTFLDDNPIIQASLESMLAQLAMAAGTNWRDTAEVLHPLSRKGHSIGRWLPSFLLIDGPLGRLLRDRDSPLNEVLKTQHRQYPLLAQARDVFNHPLFKRLRNGFAHWSFVWTQDERIVAIDYESGEETAALSILECEALHHLTTTVVEALDVVLIRPRPLA